MKSKNAKKVVKRQGKKKCPNNEKAPGKHSKEEIISEEELDNRIAIDGDIRLYFTMYLKSLLMDISAILRRKS